MKDENSTSTIDTSVTLDYWKNHITMHNVLACELSYSLIYNNIHPEKVKQALATVHLTELPNRFFLIQVDDYYNYSNNMQITQEFYQKLQLIQILRDCMEKMKLQGFVANLIGIDKIICFLCFQENNNQVYNYLFEIAEFFKKSIRKHSQYTISICISPKCSHLWQYSHVHPLMVQALNKSYFSGKEFSIFLEKEETSMPKEEVSLNGFYPELLAVFSSGNRERMETLLQSMVQTLLDSGINPDHAKMELLHLVQRVLDYGMYCGISSAEIKELSDKILPQILSCGFIADTRRFFMDFFDCFSLLLKKLRPGKDRLFCAPVREYIEMHYMENISLKNLAELTGFSEGHFTRIFRKEFDMTFIQYLTNRRIAHSKELLLDSSVPIEQIAYQVGINSYSYFCTCFKRLCGISPGEYRKNNLNELS